MIVQESDVLIYPYGVPVMSQVDDAKPSRIHLRRNREICDCG